MFRHVNTKSTKGNTVADGQRWVSVKHRGWLKLLLGFKLSFKNKLLNVRNWKPVVILSTVGGKFNTRKKLA